DAYPTPRPGRGPAGNGLRPVQSLAARAALRFRQGAAGRRLRGPVPDAPGRTPGPAAPEYTPRPGGRPADTPRPARPPGAHDRAGNVWSWPARPPVPATVWRQRSVQQAYRLPLGAQRPRERRAGCAPPSPD